MEIKYLKLISPKGLMANYIRLEWDLIEKMCQHWLKTGENQFDEFMEIFSFLYQAVDFEKKKTRFVNEFIILVEPLLKGKYIFGIEDMFSKEQCEIIKSIYEIKTTPKKSKRSRRVCIVSQIKTVREAVFKRDGYKCKFCGSKKDLTVDHIISVEQGGKDEFSNFQTLCKICNSSKSNKSLEH